MITRIVGLGAIVSISLNSAFADLSVTESALSCVTPPSGLVSWWRGEGNANDSAGTNNGTLQGGATFAPGKVGQGFRFDGTNGYVQIPDSGALKPTNVTVEAWVWLDPSLPSGHGGEQIVFKKNTWSAWFEGYSLLKETIANGDGTYSDRFQFCVSRNGDQVAINSQTIAQRGVWYHVAATYDGNRSVLYVNGVAEATATPGFALDYDTTPVFIGTSGTWPPYLSMFGGIIDEASIYNRALSASEIAAIYTAGSAGKCSSSQVCVPPPSDLVSWWRGEGNANDSAGANNGTAVGGVSYTNGEVGQAFQLDGTSGYVDVPASGSLNVGTNSGFTMEGWINPNDVSAQHPVAEYEFDGIQSGVHFWLTTAGVGSLYANIVDVNNGAHIILSSPGIVHTGVFQHVALTYDKATGVASLYYNGLAVVTSHLGVFTPKTTTDLLLGRRIDAGSGYYFKGMLDEFSLYHRALSSNEIAAIYSAGSAGKCTPSCLPPPSNLVAWWRAEDNANDSVGTNNGTASVGVSYTNGEVGQAFQFDGYAGNISVPPSPSLNIGTGSGVTIEGWIKPNDPNQIGMPVVEWDASPLGGPDGLQLWVESGLRLFGNVKDTLGNNHTFVSATGVVGNGIFQHVALTYDKSSGMAYLYLNGNPKASANFGNITPQTTYPLFLGRRTFTQEHYRGLLDEISLYNRALSSNEIMAIYQAGSTGKCPLSPPSCVPPPSGLISWWPGEGNADDVVGTNDGTLVGGVTFTTGKVGQAFHLDGTNQYVQIADSPSLKPTNVSVEAWVKLDTLVTPGANIPGQQIIVFKKNTRSGNFEGYTLLKDRVNNRDCFSFAIASAGGIQIHALSQTIPLVGTWYHLVGTYDGTTVRLYVNGVLEGSAYAGFPLDYGTRPVFFGRTGEFWVANFGGSIDEVSIYNRALTAGEIQSLYRADGIGKCPPLVPPIILVQPHGQTVNAGDTATFSVVAEGSRPLYYQWFFNSNALLGATSPTLTLTNTQPDQGGLYSVVVSNAVGVAVSSNALLHVNQIPVADASATVARVFVCTCTDTNAAVVLDGTRSYDLDGDPLQYFWFEEGVSTPLATGAVAVVLLPPGTYPIELIVSDGLAADTNVVVVKVLTATQAIGDIIGVIDNSDIAHQQPLIANLMAASDSVARCNLVSAVNQLAAFQNKVLAQIAPDDAALAQTLIASAQEIINSLENCGGGPPGRSPGKINARHGLQDGKVHLEFEGRRGQSYIIETSSDLTHWVKVGVATDLQNGNFEFDDNNSIGAPMLFYRVVAP